MLKLSITSLTTKEVNQIVDIFSKISRYKILSGYKEMEYQKSIYTDPNPNDPLVKRVFLIKDRTKVIFLVGRRGTGKTTILNRARIECLESFSNRNDQEFLSDERILSVYIDIKSVYENAIKNLTGKNDDFEEVDKLLKLILTEILMQFNDSYEELSKLGIIDDKIRKKIQIIIDQGVRDILNGRSIVPLTKTDKINNFFLLIKNHLQKVDLKIFSLETREVQKDDEKWKNLFDSTIFLNTIHKLRDLKEFPINYFLFLIDEFSEISLVNQKIIIDSLVEPLYRSAQNQSAYFCIACYPYLYYQGTLQLIHDCDILELDVFKLYKDFPYKERLKKAIQLLRKLLFKRLILELPNTFKTIDDVDLLFDISYPQFYLHLYYMTMNIPRFIGEILNYSKCKRALKNRSNIKITEIRDASKDLYKSSTLYNYFELKSYFTESLIESDRALWNYLIKFQKNLKSNKKPSGFLIIDEEVIEKELFLLTRLEMMGFLFKIDSRAGKNTYKIYKNEEPKTRKQGFYCMYYGVCEYNDIPFNLIKDPDFWRDNPGTYHITREILKFIEDQEWFECGNCGHRWEITEERNLNNYLNFECNLTDECKEKSAKIIRKRRITPKKVLISAPPEKFKPYIDDFEQILSKLDKNKKVVLHTLYKFKDEEFPGRKKGKMFANEIGTTKRISPFILHYNTVNKICRDLGTLEDLGLGLIEDKYTLNSKNIYNLADKGLLLKEYEDWKITNQE